LDVFPVTAPKSQRGYSGWRAVTFPAAAVAALKVRPDFADRFCSLKELRVIEINPREERLELHFHNAFAVIS